MRRLCLILLCLVLLAVPVAAVNEITSLQGAAVVTAGGSCQVSLGIKLHLEEEPAKLLFPLPAGARSVSVNGKHASAGRKGDHRTVNLSRYVGGPGEYLLNLNYTLDNLVHAADDGLHVLELPLLSGFAYPISGLEFTVSMPGELQTRPSFSSGYLQETIEEQLVFTYTGSTISGVVNGQLKDHETLTMTVEVPPEQFQGVQDKITSVLLTDIMSGVLAAAAVLYWVLTLRCLPVWPTRSPVTPVGVNVGELGSRLTMAGADLTMMVLHWASLGYLMIQMDDNGRVLLYKRMDMGNERSSFEVRWFRCLFGHRQMIDGTGYHYARLCRKVMTAPNKGHGIFHAHSGNPGLFRCIAAGTGFFWGISMALRWGQSTFWQVLTGIFLAALGGYSSWMIQKSGQYLHLRDRRSLYWAVILGCVWMFFGFVTAAPGLTALVILFEFLAGTAAAYGGRRSDSGRHIMQQILALRRYLRTISKEEVQRIQQTNPEYFFEMLPYAMALGVDKAFARRFRNRPLPDCSYLVSRMSTSMNAMEWTQRFRDGVQALDERYHQIPWERLFGK